MSAAVQLNPHKAGDVWPGISSVVIKVDGAPLNLTGKVVEMMVKRYVTDALHYTAGSEETLVLPGLTTVVGRKGQNY